MTAIRLTTFRGMVPKTAAQLLGQEFAQVATDCLFLSGELRPEFADVAAGTLGLTDPLTIWPYRGAWLEWAARVNIIKTPVYDDPYERLYYTGDGVPKVRSVLDGVENVRTLGIPAPTVAPSVSREGGPATPDYTVSRSYCYTYVSPYGEEGPPSPPSSIVDVSPPNEYVKVSGFAALVDAARPISTIRIYRTVSSAESTEYQFVADLPMDSAAVYNDRLLDEETAEILLSTNWYPPVDGLSGLIVCPAGFAAGFQGKSVYFSETALPHAWPAAWAVTVPDDIVAIASMGNSVAILTDKGTYLATGSSQDAMTVAQLADNQPCLCASGVVSMGGVIVYPSPDGLAAIDGNTVSILTAQLFDRADWQSLEPSGLVTAYYNKCLYLFTPVAALAINFNNDRPDLSYLTIEPSSVYIDNEADRFYFADGTALQYVGTSGLRKTAAWVSRLWMMPKETAFGWARVQASGYPVTLTGQGEHGSSFSLEIHSAVARRVPLARRQKNWTLTLSSAYPVQELVLAEALKEVTG